MIKFKILHNRNLKILCFHYFLIFPSNLIQIIMNQVIMKYLNYLEQFQDQKQYKTILYIFNNLYQVNSLVIQFNFILYYFTLFLDIQMHYQKNLLKILLSNVLFQLNLIHFNQVLLPHLNFIKLNMELHIINNKNNLLILNIYLVHFLEGNLNQMFYKLQVKYIHFEELQ